MIKLLKVIKYKMEALLQKEFEAVSVQQLGRGYGGCISDGMGYDLDNGRQKIFVKRNKNEEAKAMFNGEYQSLARITVTNTVRVPCPEKVLALPGTSDWVFAMEYIEMSPLNKHMRQLGVQLARLHLDNLAQESKGDSHSIHVKPNCVFEPRFGFVCDTCCGSIPMPNEWESDWINFYTIHRLKYQVDLAMKKHYNKEVLEYWSLLERKLPLYFKGLDIKPSLLHGDLWSGNASETVDGPVVFDAASFYGHSEFDLAITRMFGGFDRDFYESYHSLIPKTPGFDSRQDLYLLFHYLNHWNHFGSSYMQQSLRLMKKLT